jgi:hypothetical protein
MTTIVFFLEEPSAREMLEGLLPSILPEGFAIKYLVFQGKQDLEKNLVGKLRGWQAPDSVFIVMRDQDAGDCTMIKNKLLELCRQSGKEDVVVRVACRELESFYLVLNGYLSAGIVPHITMVSNGYLSAGILS